mgnify:CR=1 FL=1
MPRESDVEDVLNLVANRIDFLEFLDGDRVPKRTIADELDYSRSTVNRVISALADAELVDDAPGGCQTTSVGSLLVDQYDDHVQTVTDVLAGHEVLASLSLEATLPLKVLADAETSMASGPDPYEPYHAIEALLDRAVGQVRVYVPTFSNPRGIRLARDLATTLDLELVFDDELLEELRSDIPERMEELFELEKFTGYRTTSGPEYTIFLVATESGTAGAIVSHSPEGGLVGCLVTDNPTAIQWMERQYSEVKAESERLDTVLQSY